MRTKLTEAWVAITADKKKAAVLGVLTLVALATVTKALLSQRKQPGLRPSAQASGPAQTSGARGAALVKAENPVVRVEAPVVRLAAIPPLSRNLFLASERHFPYPAQTEASSGTPAKSPDGTDEKSEEEIERALAEERARLVNKEASGLRLRSTMLGTSPVAVVESGKGARGGSAVLRVGQTFEGFTLVEVHRESAILEKNGVRVEIRLPLP